MAKTSVFPRAITLEKAKEILRDKSKMAQSRTDILAVAWHTNPNFSRKETAAQMSTTPQTVSRMIDWLAEANELAAGRASDGTNSGKGNATGEHQALTGPQLLAMIDTQLVEADREGRNRDFQVLLSARQSIADASSEVAAASVDPMRLCGKRGLDGMPDRVIAVIEVIKPHMQKRYPKLWQYLCDFGKDTDAQPDPTSSS